MKEYLKKKGLFILILVVVVALILGLSVHLRSGRAGFLSNAAGALRAPVQHSAAAVVQWLESIYGYLYKYDQLVEENGQLHAELAETQEQLRLAADALEENERFRKLLNFQEKHSDFQFEPAKIIAWDPSNWASSFTISKGSDHGIELGDAVVTEYEALVGQVVELGDSWATVRTVIDVDFGTGALVGANGSAAMVIGDFKLMQQQKARLSYLTDGSGVFEEDVILTSGEGGFFPQGLVIGSISALQTDDGGQSIYGVVEPAAVLSNLTQVFVIKDYEIVE